MVINKENTKIPIKANVFNKVQENQKFNCVIGAVNHSVFKKINLSEWKSLSKENGIYFDIKGMMPRELEALRL